MRTQVERIGALSKGGPSAGGDRWRASLFGPAYSSDNAGDGPRVKNGVPSTLSDEPSRGGSPVMSSRDRALMRNHIIAAKAHNSNANQEVLVVLTQLQFARKLTQFRAHKKNCPLDRRLTLEKFIQDFPFNDVHCLEEPPVWDFFETMVYR